MSKCIYCVGDIHGRKDLLVAIRKIIKADAKKNGFTDKTIIYIGDYIDRGPDSKGVLDLLIKKPLKDFTNIHLKGNHEEMMLETIKWSATSTATATWSNWSAMWLENGGKAALKSYGVDWNDLYSGKVKWADLQNIIPKKHVEWLESLPVHRVIDPYLFVHAGIKPGLPLWRQKPRTMMWIRDEFLRSDLDHGYRVVHGHCPTRGFVDIKENRINLDTGSVFRGVQFALAIHDDQERIIKTPRFPILSKL